MYVNQNQNQISTGQVMQVQIPPNLPYPQVAQWHPSLQNQPLAATILTVAQQNAHSNGVLCYAWNELVNENFVGHLTVELINYYANVCNNTLLMNVSPTIDLAEKASEVFIRFAGSRLELVPGLAQAIDMNTANTMANAANSIAAVLDPISNGLNPHQQQAVVGGMVQQQSHGLPGANNMGGGGFMPAFSSSSAQLRKAGSSRDPFAGTNTTQQQVGFVPPEQASVDAFGDSNKSFMDIINESESTTENVESVAQVNNEPETPVVDTSPIASAFGVGNDNMPTSTGAFPVGNEIRSMPDVDFGEDSTAEVMNEAFGDVTESNPHELAEDELTVLRHRFNGEFPPGTLISNGFMLLPMYLTPYSEAEEFEGYLSFRDTDLERVNAVYIREDVLVDYDKHSEEPLNIDMFKTELLMADEIKVISRNEQLDVTYLSIANAGEFRSGSCTWKQIPQLITDTKAIENEGEYVVLNYTSTFVDRVGLGKKSDLEAIELFDVRQGIEAFENNPSIKHVLKCATIARLEVLVADYIYKVLGMKRAEEGTYSVMYDSAVAVWDHLLNHVAEANADIPVHADFQQMFRVAKQATVSDEGVVADEVLLYSDTECGVNIDKLAYLSAKGVASAVCTNLAAEDLGLSNRVLGELIRLSEHTHALIYDQVLCAFDNENVYKVRLSNTDGLVCTIHRGTESRLPVIEINRLEDANHESPLLTEALNDEPICEEPKEIKEKEND